jgi:hypothetical protein
MTKNIIKKIELFSQFAITFERAFFGIEIYTQKGTQLAHSFQAT